MVAQLQRKVVPVTAAGRNQAFADGVMLIATDVNEAKLQHLKGPRGSS